MRIKRQEQEEPEKGFDNDDDVADGSRVKRSVTRSIFYMTWHVESLPEGILLPKKFELTLFLDGSS